MAELIELEFMTEQHIAAPVLQGILGERGISVLKMTSIDNWEWENDKHFDDLGEMVSIADEEKIVVLDLSGAGRSNMGMYLKKINAEYVYSFWWDADESQIFALESGTGSARQILCEHILDILETHALTYKFIAVGVEMVFSYDEDIFSTLRKTKNDFLWILCPDTDIDLPERYRRNHALSSPYGQIWEAAVRNF